MCKVHWSEGVKICGAINPIKQLSSKRITLKLTPRVQLPAFVNNKHIVN